MYEEIYEALIKAREGDVKSKEWIINSLNPLIIASIKRYYYKSLEFEDLLQEGKLVILECIDNYDITKGTYFLGYVKTMLRYFYLDKHKQKQTSSLNEKIGEDEENELVDLLVSDIDEPVDALLKSEENQVLSDSLDLLTKRQREVIIYFYYEGLSIAHIAEKLGVSYRTIVNTKTKALEIMKKLLVEKLSMN
ncbi:sigma-70 family RNA polymerase sigma factor [Tissierella sp. Yu-01]|uniref:sigma-70 family RNA polymerase sigma factor n=1 Tax=Tissierella sp. Yu-01 TaxID=3035694 RepID=UPI00240D5D44|nr:sigma-70 family RNA polymerase sigma factor [Tissierella sp. Yu-01]WFA08633.1 sigma-70 family RNA polymerase sigma factor [Tissierella sp. Yu-01]